MSEKNPPTPSSGRRRAISLSAPIRPDPKVHYVSIRPGPLALYNLMFAQFML